jgi:LAO/AO transport system kinase
MTKAKRQLSLDEYEAGLRAGDRSVLGQALSLVESENPRHREDANQLLQRLYAKTGAAHRIGITGVPGVGKSTFIEALGSLLTSLGKRVAVLAVDPSSVKTGGSILGDKTRMTKLAADPSAFIRPSPSSGTLGGVARRTREMMLVFEAAGYDVVLVETVGVGQSEAMVYELVDTFLLLLLPGAGDDLQGIKRGILELVDLVLINKADGDAKPAAERARHQYQNALHILRSDEAQPPAVGLCSALEGTGIDAAWAMLSALHEQAAASGELETRRRRQLVRWMWALVDEGLRSRFLASPSLKAALVQLEPEVETGRIIPPEAARRLLALWSGSEPSS